jgi:hypothetical protein
MQVGQAKKGDNLPNMVAFRDINEASKNSNEFFD